MKKQEKNQQRENTNKTESKKSCDKINKKFENSNDSFKFSLICTLNYGIIFIML